MLSLASIESSDRARIDEPVSLDETILGACDQLRSVAAANRVTLQPQLSASCLIASEEGLLQTLWVTLLENAIRYSKPDSAIQIFCVLENRSGIVTVQDHGAGIAKEYLPHIFERFYRADASRSRDSGGFGLGLAIAKAIVKRHNGRIEVKSQPGLGTTVQIALPCIENLH
jgi:signal transduction histidine kinase